MCTKLYGRWFYKQRNSDRSVNLRVILTVIQGTDRRIETVVQFNLCVVIV